MMWVRHRILITIGSIDNTRVALHSPPRKKDTFRTENMNTNFVMRTSTMSKKNVCSRMWLRLYLYMLIIATRDLRPVMNFHVYTCVVCSCTHAFPCCMFQQADLNNVCSRCVLFVLHSCVTIHVQGASNQLQNASCSITLAIHNRAATREGGVKNRTNPQQNEVYPRVTLMTKLFASLLAQLHGWVSSTL